MYHIINIEVKKRLDETDEKLVKRFLKKCKKVDIVKEYFEKTQYYLTRSQKRRLKSIKARNQNQKDKNSKNF